MDIKSHSFANGLITCMIITLILGNFCYGAELDHVYAIQSATVVTVTQGIIKNGTVVIRNGLIESVGQNIAIPVEAEIVDAESLTVYPGFIDAHGSLALKTSKEPEKKEDTSSRRPSRKPTPILEPEKYAYQIIDSKDTRIEQMRNCGITSILTIPPDGIFIGQSCLLNLAGEKKEEMTLKNPAALHMGFARQPGEYPSTLMAVLAFQEQTFYNAQHYQKEVERYEKSKRGFQRPEFNPSLEAIIPVLQGRQKVIMQANTENEIRRAVRLAKDFNLDYLLSGATEGWLAIDLLEKEKRPIIISLDFPRPEEVTGYSFHLEIEGPRGEKQLKEKGGPKSDIKEKKDKDAYNEIYANAGKIHQAGLPFAFSSRGMKKPEDFIEHVSKTVEAGLPKEIAVQALTIYPARMLGISDQTGSIEEGKIANLVLTKGALFNESYQVKWIFIDGKKFEVKEKSKKNSRKEERNE